MEKKSIYKRKFYKQENTIGINNLQIVSMIHGDREVAGCFIFSKNRGSIGLKDTLVFIDEAFLSKLSKYFGNGKYIKNATQINL